MFILTAHAIQQYCARLAPGMPHSEAEALLTDEIARADRMKEKSAKGDTVWRLPSGAYLVTKRDRGNDVAVTVLSSLHGKWRGNRQALNDRTLPEDEDE